MTKPQIDRSTARYIFWTAILRISIAVGVIALLKLAEPYYHGWAAQ